MSRRSSVETAINSGTILGDAVLEEGDDTFINSSDSVNSLIDGGAGNDSLTGSSGEDSIGGSADTVWAFGGGNGNNSLDGGNRDDEFFGDQDMDTMLGGNGADTMYGGLDADVFVYTDINQTGTTAMTQNRIMDFQADQDVIDL